MSADGDRVYMSGRNAAGTSKAVSNGGVACTT